MDPTIVLVPGADFVRDIDALLKKASPDIAIPWAGSATPPWSAPRGFRHIVDVGAGLGAFTGATIAQLGRWRLLDELQALTLIDGDRDLFRPDPTSGTQRVCDELAGVVAQGRPQDANAINPQYVMEDAKVVPGGIEPLRKLGLKPDLIIASHVTYYLGDGSGLDLVRGLLTHLAPGGMLWLVIRKLDCAIYQERAATLARLHRPDPKPRDYAELFLRERGAYLSTSRIVCNRTYQYPMRMDRHQRMKAIHLLMWRAHPDAEFPEGIAAAQRVNETAEYPFSEEHILLSN